MTLNFIQSTASAAGVTIMLEDGAIFLDGPVDAVDELAPLVKQYKPELIKVLNGETIADVGHCDRCNADLIGLPVDFDGYVNRVCGACGRWAVCMPPDWTPDDVTECIAERSAIMQHDGQLSKEDADTEAREAITAQFEEQKSIFESAERIEYKSGRRSGRTDDRVTPTIRS